MKNQKKNNKTNSSKNESKKFIYKENMTLKEVASSLGMQPFEIIQKLLSMGQMANINSILDRDCVELITLDTDYKFVCEEEIKKNEILGLDENEDPKNLVKRPPIITIMGHVDHGKTTLLDTIRKTNVVSGEFGGITQHIGAYQIKRNNEYITFIDTPGHAAFTEMRARGAEITDIVVLVVAADDGIMPQTIESIDHAKAAKVPIIVAINKIDKPSAKPDQVMTKLSEIGVVPDTWGGDYQFVEISAKSGKNIDELLDTILILSELKELKANPNKPAVGTVIEAKLDKGRGPVATIIIKNGSLNQGDYVLVGKTIGKVRTITNDKLENLKTATPSQAVEITGLNEVPNTGDRLRVFKCEKDARLEVGKILEKEKIGEVKKTTSLSDLNSENDNLNLIIKADVKGSIEAISNLLSKLNIENLKINIVSSGVGAPTESDLLLAVASKSLIINFNVSPSAGIKKMAKEKNIELRLYNVIYQIEDDIKNALKGMLEPEYDKVVIGEAVVRETFKLPKGVMIAGIYITDGIVKRKAYAKVIRDDKVIYENKIASLKHLKDDKKELQAGLEGGLTIEGYNDFKIDDRLEIYELKEIDL